MSSTSDSSAIDEKKGEDTENDNLGKDIGKFFLSLLILILILLFNFSMSGCVLYGCKIAQSNILPTDVNCMPFVSNNEATITPNKINIFEITKNDKTLSEKISFTYNKNNKYLFLDILRGYKEKTGSNVVVNYFISIIETLFAFNFSSFNVFLDLLNTMLPESIILIFGSIISLFYTFCMIFVNFFYFVYLWFYNMSWFFMVDSNTSETGKPKWESTVNPGKLIMGCILAFIFFIIFFIGLIIIPFVPFVPFVTLISCLFTIIGYKGEMNGQNVSVFSIISDSFKYHKTAITSIISIIITVCAFANLGGLIGMSCIFVLMLIYFGTISIDIFTPINEEKLSPLVSYEQAKKICRIKKEFSVSGFVKSFFKGGKNITSDLKKINKNK